MIGLVHNHIDWNCSLREDLEAGNHQRTQRRMENKARVATIRNKGGVFCVGGVDRLIGTLVGTYSCLFAFKEV